MDKEASGYSRRRARRVKISIDAMFDIIEPYEARRAAGNKQFSAKVVDISEKGIAISTHINLPVRTILSIKFVITNPAAQNEPDKLRRIAVVGEVRNTTIISRMERRVGILFTRIDDGDRRVIANVVSLM